MVVVKIELWPGGDKSKARLLGVATIANQGTGDATHGNYKVDLTHSGVYFGKPGTWRTGYVLGHRRDLSPYHLVMKALMNALGIKQG